VKLHLTPTSLTTKENKKKWLIYELLRYREFIRFAQTIKMLLGMVIVWLCGQLGGVVGIVIMVIGLLVFDNIYELFIFSRLRNFYEDLPKAAFDIDNNSEHDLRILMNRVDNFIKNKDSKALEECYTNLQLKYDITEALADIIKDLKKA
jgi:hypothetical protein